MHLSLWRRSAYLPRGSPNPHSSGGSVRLSFNSRLDPVVGAEVPRCAGALRP
jgi:hypothetical protein